MNDSETVILITVITVALPSILGVVIWYIKTKFTFAIDLRRIAEEKLKTETEEKHKLDIAVQVKRYEHKIKDFYYPIYIRLVAGEHAYKKVIGPRRTNTISTDIRRLLLKQEIMPAHEKIIEIYTNNAYMIEGDNTLLYEFIKFAQHLAVLKSIHKTKNDHISARELGAPYPTNLLPVLHDRFMRDSQDYNKLVGHIIYKNDLLIGGKSKINLLDDSPQRSSRREDLEHSSRSYNSSRSDEEYTNSTTVSDMENRIEMSPPRRTTPKYYRSTASPSNSKSTYLTYDSTDIKQLQDNTNSNTNSIEEDESVERSIYSTINTEIDPESLNKMKESMDRWTTVRRRFHPKHSPSIEYDSNCEDRHSNLSI